ncbi:hypothetical protein [Nonomuraea jabiensis]|uniref:hypothetical protein n=1 Tax=Nonomuraea jabiensis TaxID=882448 RepID=UPI003D75DCD3
MTTPLGRQSALLTLSLQGDTPSGTLNSRIGSGQLDNISIGGDTVTWRITLSLPRPIEAEFTANIAGDVMSGTVRLGSLGTAPFTGARA